MHLDRGEVVQADTVHHVERHDGNWEKFISSPLQSLCASCDNSIAQSIERLGYDKTIGVDGWPIGERSKIKNFSSSSSLKRRGV